MGSRISDDADLVWTLPTQISNYLPCCLLKEACPIFGIRNRYKPRTICSICYRFSRLANRVKQGVSRSVSQIVGRLYQGSSLPLFILQREECGYMSLRMNELKRGVAWKLTSSACIGENALRRVITWFSHVSAHLSLRVLSLVTHDVKDVMRYDSCCNNATNSHFTLGVWLV